MKSMPNRNLLLFLSSVVLFFTACYQPKEGCLDINATNFDATADEECCCQYPVLQLKFKHFASGNEFSASDTILNDFGQQFRIPSFAFYFSDFEFTGTSGNKVQVSDTIRLPAPFDSIVLKKDIALVRAITSNALLGRFIQEESFTKLYFQVGVPSAADGAVLIRHVHAAGILGTVYVEVAVPAVGADIVGLQCVYLGYARHVGHEGRAYRASGTDEIPVAV